MNGMIILWIGYWDGMRAWWWNESHFIIQGIALLQKYPSFHPHSVIPTSFLNDETALNEVKMNRMTLEWYSSIVIFIPCHSKHSKMKKEWRNEWEWRWFWKWTINWILRYMSFCHHSIIPASFHFGKSFSLWNELEWGRMGWEWLTRCCIVSEWDVNDEMTFEWWNDIQMIILAPRVLLPRPPWCHSKICIASRWVEG